MEFRCYYSDCLRSYNSKYNLKRHINTNHLKLKSYPCDQCSRSFASKKNLQKHLMTHTQIVAIDMSKKSKIKKNKDCCETVEVGIIPLAKYYKEVLLLAVTNPVLLNQSMPSLPPVERCRLAHQKNVKVPLLPALLDYVNLN